MKKLLRDFLRLRSVEHVFPRDRRATPPRHGTITVPAPREQAAHPLAIDMHWQVDPTGARPVAHWHPHRTPLGTGA